MKSKHVLLQLGYMSQRRMESITTFAKEHGWCIAVEDRSTLPHGWTGDGAMILLRDRQPKAVDFALRLVTRGVPVIDLSICHPEIDLPRVVGDHFAIGALAAKHFLERRFKHATFFSKNWTNVERLRLNGFLQRWEGLPPQTWIWRKECSERHYDDWEALSRWLAAKISNAPKPLALFAFNDNDAARAESIALANGISIPEEVAILGVDDEPLIVENQIVPLSSIRHDLGSIGFKSASLLDSLMEGGTPPGGPVLVPPQGISIRRSTDVVATASPLARCALRLIGKHLCDAYGIDQLARDLGVSRATLHRQFMAELGVPPSKEILRQRMAKAKLLLATGDLPIKAIAHECGFCDNAHFSNVFRRETGQTPRSFKG